MLILHGDLDSRTHLANSRELAARAAAAAGGGGGDVRLEEVAGGNHMLLYDRPDVTRRVLDQVAAWVGDRA